MKKIYYAIISFALTLMAVFVGIFPKNISASASESTLSYDQTNVLDDLKNSTIDGEAFSLTKYSFNAFEKTRVISFVEYCYSYNPSNQGNYGLYVYVYNPQGLLFETDHALNQIQFSYALESNTSYSKYKLAFLNCSTEPDYEGLFYKFKVVLSVEQKKEILKNLNSTERVYRVSGIELLQYGQTNATEYAVATTYKYSGYSTGYGSNSASESTLKCQSEQAEVLSLNVHPTYYRPDGTNGKNNYTQDSLHSVYFAVPNDVIEKYGVMSAVHATWLSAVLAPSLVTGNYNAYSAILPYLGKSIPENHTDDLYYMYYGAHLSKGTGHAVATNYYGYSFNALEAWSGHQMIHSEYGDVINPLYSMYYAGSDTDSADNYTVSSKKILSTLKESKVKYGGELVNDKYSRYMFESVDKEFTDVYIRADETYSLTDSVVDYAWWKVALEGYLGIKPSENTTTTVFNSIQAIYAVQEDDLDGTVAQVAEKLYISESDYNDFYDFYYANKSFNTVYLFRYKTSEYISQEATLYSYDSNKERWNQSDTNAYFFQEEVDLDFDVIDVTFSNGRSDTVIPVVSSPIDVVNAATPPVYTQSDKPPYWLYLLIALVIIAVLSAIFNPVLNAVMFILKAVCWIVSAPVRLICLIAETFKGEENEKSKRSKKKKK